MSLAQVRSVSLSNTALLQAQRLSFLVSGEDTQGQLAVVEVLERRGFEAPQHSHRHEDEIIRIIEGEMRFWLGNQTLRAKCGDVVLLPRGIPHSYRLESESAHYLLSFAPAGLENYLRALSQPVPNLDLPLAPSRPPNIPQWVALGQDYGLEYLPYTPQ